VVSPRREPTPDLGPDRNATSSPALSRDSRDTPSPQERYGPFLRSDVSRTRRSAKLPVEHTLLKGSHAHPPPPRRPRVRPLRRPRVLGGGHSRRGRPHRRGRLGRVRRGPRGRAGMLPRRGRFGRARGGRVAGVRGDHDVRRGARRHGRGRARVRGARRGDGPHRDRRGAHGGRLRTCSAPRPRRARGASRSHPQDRRRARP
jgi:hypothetical protein